MDRCLILILVFSLLFSCSNNQTESQCDKMDIKPSIDENYQAALQQQMKGLNSMDSNAEQARKRVKELESNHILQWLQGNWEWRGTIDGYRNSCRLGVSDDYAVLATPRGVLDQGKITIDYDDNTIHFGNTYINFDYDNGKLGDFANGMYYKKMQNNANSRTSHGSSKSSSDSYGSNSRLMAKFNKLNEEGRRLVGDIGQYYNTGQAGPWVIPEIYRLKQIQDEKISLAQQMGDEELEAISRQQKTQTLLALRQMGF